MIRIFLPLICAALGFAAASCSQSEEPLAPAVEVPASPHPTSHDAASAAMASPPDPGQANSAGQPASDQAPADQAPSDQTPSDQAAPASDQASAPAAPQSAVGANPDSSASAPVERRASTLIGMPVVAADGSQLGQVKDIIFDRQGRATHVVIAYGTVPQTNPGAAPNEGEAPSTPDGKLTAMPWDAAMAAIKGSRLVLDNAQLQGAPSFTPDAWPDLDNPAWSATTDAYWRKTIRAAIAAHPGAPIDSTSRQRGRPIRDGE